MSSVLIVNILLLAGQPYHLSPNLSRMCCTRNLLGTLDHGLAIRAGSNPLDLAIVSKSLPSRNTSDLAYLDSNKLLDILKRLLAHGILTLGGIVPRHNPWLA